MTLYHIHPTYSSPNTHFSGLSQGLALFYVGFFIRYSPPQQGTPHGAAGYVAIVAIYIFAAVYQFGWGPVVWTYCSVRLNPSLYFWFFLSK